MTAADKHEPFDVRHLQHLTPLERKRAAEDAVKAETRRLPRVDNNGQLLPTDAA